jgi:hypothetical protein
LLEKPGWYSVAGMLFFQVSVFVEPGMRSIVPQFADASTPVQTLPGIDVTSPVREVARHSTESKPTLGSSHNPTKQHQRTKKVRLVPHDERHGTGERRSEFLRRNSRTPRESQPPPEFDCEVHTLPPSELDDFSILLNGSEEARQLLRNTLVNAYFDSSFQVPIKNRPRRPPRLVPNLPDLQYRERQMASCAALNVKWMDHAAASDDYIDTAWGASQQRVEELGRTNREQEQTIREQERKIRGLQAKVRGLQSGLVVDSSIRAEEIPPEGNLPEAQRGRPHERHRRGRRRSSSRSTSDSSRRSGKRHSKRRSRSHP